MHKVLTGTMKLMTEHFPYYYMDIKSPLYDNQL